MTEQRNWAGNYTYQAANRYMPETAEEIQRIARQSRRVKALGTRHSFNNIADTSEALLSLEHFDKILALDAESRTVTIEGGVRYGPLARHLHSRGWALPNLASLPHISVAGACATATHGSGTANQCLSAAVSAIELVDGNGDVRTLSREQDGDTFHGAVVHLGALGVVTKLTLDLVPAFTLRQDLYENLPLESLEENFDGIMSSAYSVSLFTDWQQSRFNQVWIKRLAQEGDAFTPEPALHGASLALKPLHPIGALSAENCTEQMGICGAWHERLPHFRMEFVPSHGEELQSEYIVPRCHAVAALRALEKIRGLLVPLLLIAEVRAIAADSFWMSPFCGQDSVALHFTWKQDEPAVEKLLPRLEEALEPFSARPHWGKLFTLSPARLRALYPRLPDFLNLAQAYDPEGKFRNAYLERYLFSG